VYSTGKPVPEGVNNHGEAFGLVRSQKGLPTPDLHILFIDSPGHMPEGVGTESGFTIGVSPMVPYSRGTLRLRNAKPGAMLALDPNYFGDDRDMVAVLNGLGMARQIAEGRALTSWSCNEVLPGPELKSEESLRRYVKSTLASYSHPVGTSRTGDDESAVVDNTLRVRGLTSLRVADASVLPSIPSGNTNATAYAIGERAAALLTNE
jgi:choline dehydrogenase